MYPIFFSFTFPHFPSSPLHLNHLALQIDDDAGQFLQAHLGVGEVGADVGLGLPDFHDVLDIDLVGGVGGVVGDEAQGLVLVDAVIDALIDDAFAAGDEHIAMAVLE